jgi:tetratricopeptide (TPR) repeat protein/transcriptional regulator with XRE-family HTH domain
MTTFGEKMRALMAERHLSLGKLGTLVNYDKGYLSKVSRDLRPPPAGMAAKLDLALGADGALLALAPEHKVSAQATPTTDSAAALVATLKGEVIDLAIWAEQTNVGDTTVEYLAAATQRLARDYLSKPPVPVLTEAVSLYRRVSELLRGGGQDLRHARDLHVITGQLLAFLSWASSDLGQGTAAEAYASAGWVMADQSDHDPLRAMVLIAQSKNAFWEGQYAQAAEFAQRGQRHAPTTETRVLLACQESDAWQALGDIARAQDAQRRACEAREVAVGVGEVGGLWACGRARQANYSIGVSLRAGDVAGALASAREAHDAYASGEQRAYGTWAQICIGAGIAHLMAGDLDLALGEFQPVLELPGEQRLATLVSRFGDVHRRLTQYRFAGSREALALQERISDYRAEAITTRAITTGEV